MKRILPFIIIVVVGVATVGIATAVYREKMRTAPAKTASAVSPAPAEESADPWLHARGPGDAPLTLEIYGDFQCPSCAYTSQNIDELQKGEFAGKLRVIFREFPLSMHKHAAEAAMAAEAAGVQGKFWEMHDALYKYQPVWSRVNDVRYFFESYAETVGLDVARFRADSQSADVRGHVMSEGKGGQLRGVENTPTIFLNGVETKDVFTKEKMKKAIEAALAPKPGKSS